MAGLTDRVAIVTGAAGGIGAATCAALCRMGAAVIAADIQRQRAADVADDLTKAGLACHALGVDLADEASITALIGVAATRFGRLDILVNNAADQSPHLTRQDGNVEHMPPDVWDRIFQVNVRGTMLCCKHALPHLAASGRGAIVNVASNLGLQGQVIQAAYGASKAAILQMTRSIAASHGRAGIRCNAVSPGLTVSPSMLHNLPADLVSVVRDETLTPYIGEPEDIASAIAFAASDAARYMNGHNLVVDGGTVSHVPGFSRFAALFNPSEPGA